MSGGQGSQLVQFNINLLLSTYLAEIVFIEPVISITIAKISPHFSMLANPEIGYIRGHP